MVANRHGDTKKQFGDCFPQPKSPSRFRSHQSSPLTVQLSEGMSLHRAFYPAEKVLSLNELSVQDHLTCTISEPFIRHLLDLFFRLLDF